MTSSPATSALRPSWDDTWLAAAAVLGQRSLCVRAQVGCVIVAQDNRVVASGYNGPPAGFRHNALPCTSWCGRADTDQTPRMGNPLTYVGPDPHYLDCPALHAEANALSVGDRRDREGGTLYVNSHVCFNCAKLIANSGLSRVVVSAALPAVHRLPGTSYNFLRACGLAVDVRG